MMPISAAKEVIINRGFVDGIFDGDKWREAIFVISESFKHEKTGHLKFVHPIQENDEEQSMMSISEAKEVITNRIPEVATNRDVLMAMFPSIKIIPSDSELVMVYSLDGMTHHVLKSWLDAPYKEGAEE